MMKLVLVAGLVSVAFGDVSHLFNNPQNSYRSGPQIAILRLTNEVYPDGRYQYAYDTENGISAQESGQPGGSGPEAGTVAQGSYSYTSPEGVPVQIQYTADENGFQPVGNVLPTPPPIPDAILRSIQYNSANERSDSAYQSQPYRNY